MNPQYSVLQLTFHSKILNFVANVQNLFWNLQAYLQTEFDLGK